MGGESDHTEEDMGDALRNYGVSGVLAEVGIGRDKIRARRRVTWWWWASVAKWRHALGADGGVVATALDRYPWRAGGVWEGWGCMGEKK